MRIGYGYDVTPEAFAHAKVDKVYLDVPGSGRRERGALLETGRLRLGDVVVLLSPDALGPKAWAAVKGLGVGVETCPPAGPAKRPGAPLVFDPDHKQDSDIKALWLNPGFTLAYVLRRATEIMGKPVYRHHLTRAYKNRHKREGK